MSAGNDGLFRRQSLVTWAAVSAACMVISAYSLLAGNAVVVGWLITMLLSIYLFSTRTFRLTSDRYFLFIGASLPGIVILELFNVLSIREFGLIPDIGGGISTQLEVMASAYLAFLVAAAPWLSRLKVHRYTWTAASISIGTVISAATMFAHLAAFSAVGLPGQATRRMFVELAIIATLLFALVQMVLVARSPVSENESQRGRGWTRVMILAISLLLAAQGAALASCFLRGWMTIVEHVLEVAGLFAILEGLIHRGLEVPIKLITRSRSQLEAAISAAADGILVADSSGRVIAMNWRIRSATGAGLEVGVGSPASDILNLIVEKAVAPDALQRRMDQFTKSPDSEGFERVEMQDGRILEIYSIPYLFEGRIDGRLWSLRDVSVRERTTAQLERSNWRLDNILVSAGDGLFEINLDRGTLWLHSNWKNVVHCDVESVPSSWDEFRAMIHPDDIPGVNRGLRQPYSNREYRVEFRMRDRDNGWRWYLTVGRIDRIEFGTGRPEWVLNGVQRDISAEKAQESEIRRQRGLMEALIENMPLGAFVKEMPSGRYVIWNSPLARLSGIIPSQVIGKNDVELMGEATARHVTKSDVEVVSQGVSVVIENSWLGESTGRNVRLRKVPVIDADRTVKLIIGIVEDVTQQQQIERLVHQTRSLEALGRLAGGIAHDFNNILQVIIGAADALKLSAPRGGEDKEEVDQILEAGERARTLIRQLLTFSRQDTSNPEPVDVDLVISGLIRMLQRLIGADIQVNVRESGTRLLVHAEKSRLEQVFMNLTVNAVDAMPYGGVLTIVSRAVDVDEAMVAGQQHALPGRYAMVSVKDSGIGIPREVLDHMWEPFFSTKGIGKGTGLGLSTVYGIVDSLAGFVLVHSEMGRGTEFCVYLPLHAADDERPGEQSAVMPRVSIESPTVLVALQNPPEMLEVCKLMDKAGYRVLRAGSGPEALQRLLDADEAGGVRLLILDVVLAGMGGRDICERYRQDHLAVPVIFCGDQAAPVFDKSYLDEVRGRLLRRPYSQRQMMLAVRALLNR